jgi:ABC-type multidrug transport system ATPase subunit
VPDSLTNAATGTNAVELNQVSRLYGAFAALRSVSLTLPAGSSVVLLGENGAGKSTLLKIVAGLVTPTLGQVRVFGQTPREARHRLAYMSHASMLYDELTGLENLRYFAALHEAALSPKPYPLDPEQALRDVGLDPTLPRRVSDYSQGMRQRASLARVLLTQPDLLLLDEPFSNLDAASSRSMVTRLQTWLAEATTTARTLLLTTHQAELARPLAHLTLTLQNGRIATPLAV